MRKPSDYEAPLCSQVGGNWWFPEQKSDLTKPIDVRYAKRICGNCTHQNECAEWGISKEVFGIWGGLSEHQRRKIRKARKIKIKDGKVA